MKSVQIRRFFFSIFSCIRTEYEDLLSVQIRSFFWSEFACIRNEYRKIRTRKNSVFEHFSRSVHYTITSYQKSPILLCMGTPILEHIRNGDPGRIWAKIDISKYRLTICLLRTHGLKMPRFWFSGVQGLVMTSSISCKILFIVERSTSYISLDREFYADQLFCSTHGLKVNFDQGKWRAISPWKCDEILLPRSYIYFSHE